MEHLHASTSWAVAIVKRLFVTLPTPETARTMGAKSILPSSLKSTANSLYLIAIGAVLSMLLEVKTGIARQDITKFENVKIIQVS